MRLSVLALAMVACSRGDLDRGARTAITAGDPNPAAAPTTKHTIDNTGYVDPGGRTSDEWNRAVGGGRATEVGGFPPGVTVTGIPNGADLGGRGREEPPTAERAEVMPRAGGSPVANYDDIPAAVARARCDHETSCSRVGDGRTWPSQDTCMAEFRARAHGELGTCKFDRAAVATCLIAIRHQSCAPALDTPEALTSCQTTAICTP